MTTCYINGTYQDISKSKVSITDRGFQFSDGVYEVIAVYENKFIDMELHLKRLMTSLNKLKIKINLKLNQIENIPNRENTKFIIEKGTLIHILLNFLTLYTFYLYLLGHKQIQ